MTNYPDHTEWMTDDQHDQPRHISAIIHAIVAKWPDERRESFYTAMEA